MDQVDLVAADQVGWCHLVDASWWVAGASENELRMDENMMARTSWDQSHLYAGVIQFPLCQKAMHASSCGEAAGMLAPVAWTYAVHFPY